MAFKLDDKMVVGVSSRALFDLTVENEIFETEGVEAYCKYQIEHERDILKPGPGFGLIRELLRLNSYVKDRELVEVIIMSRNSPDTSLRVFNAIRYYDLPITRAVLVSGASLAPYLEAFGTDLFLSAYEDDVQCAIDSGIAAGIICTEHCYDEYGNNCGNFQPRQQFKILGIDAGKDAVRHDAGEDNGQNNMACAGIRIAFDGDAVVFTDESEKIYKNFGLTAFEKNEESNADIPLAEGPFAKFLRKLNRLQNEIGTDNCPIRTALVTSRSAPAHERVIRTLRAWKVRVDEVFFLGGIEKKDFLKAFGAQIFFDDQSIHTISASCAVPAARVPYRRNAAKKELKNSKYA